MSFAAGGGTATSGEKEADWQGEKERRLDGSSRQTARRRASWVVLRGGLRNEWSRRQMETHEAHCQIHSHPACPVFQTHSPQLCCCLSHHLCSSGPNCDPADKHTFVYEHIWFLQYLCVGLVVLGEVRGGVRAVRSRSRDRRAVGEWGRALGDHRSDRVPVHPSAWLSSLRLVSHRVWKQEKNKTQYVWVHIYMMVTLRAYMVYNIS